MSKSRQSRQGGEAVLCPRPVRLDRGQPDAPHNCAQHEGDDDRVVGVPQDWYEVAGQINRRGQVGEVGQQQPQPDPNASREGLVGGQSVD